MFSLTLSLSLNEPSEQQIYQQIYKKRKEKKTSEFDLNYRYILTIHQTLTETPTGLNTNQRHSVKPVNGQNV